MKCLSLTQPFASLVALGEKRIETRSWRTDYRGPIAIHAAKGFPAEAQRLCLRAPFNGALARAGLRVGLSVVNDKFRHDLPLGAIVATADLTACIETEDPRWRRAALDDPAYPHEEAFGDYGPDRFMWFLSDVVALPEPIPARGALGLWEWDGAGLA